jgi:hypothetical protein
VAHTYVSKAKIRRIPGQASLGKNLARFPIKNSKKNWAWWHTRHPSYPEKVNRRIIVQSYPGIKVRPY